MRDFNNYQKEGLREGLTRFARKNFPESRREKIAKARQRWQSVNFQIFWLVVLVITHFIMVIFLKTSIPIKTASYFGLDADLLFNICALLAFVWAVYLGFEHSDAYENLKQAEGKSLLDASDEYDDKYQYPLRLRPRWWFLDFFD